MFTDLIRRLEERGARTLEDRVSGSWGFKVSFPRTTSLSNIIEGAIEMATFDSDAGSVEVSESTEGVTLSLYIDPDMHDR